MKGRFEVYVNGELIMSGENEIVNPINKITCINYEGKTMGVIVLDSFQKHNEEVETMLTKAMGEEEMTLDEYQEQAISTAIYANTDIYKENPYYGQLYCALQLSAESGEIAAKYAKRIRKGELEVDKETILKELGDVLWYVANLAGELGYTLNEVAQVNIAKLTDRKERGVLHGDGDTR